MGIYGGFLMLGIVAKLFAESGQQGSDDAGRRADGVVRASELSGAYEAFLPTLFPSSHGANLLLLKNGDLLCFWFSGGWEGDGDVGILVSRLAKGSGQWTTPLRIDRDLGGWRK